MKLSIITVNYRAWGHLEKALDALQPDFPDDWELIIVDNESQAEPFSAFGRKFPWAKMIANPINSGFGHGCNIGVAHASGELLLFMNPDVIASCDDIRALLRERESHSDAAILSPKQIDINGRPQKVFDEFPAVLNQSRTIKALLRKINPGKHPDPHADYASLTWCDWVTGSFLLISRSDFDAIGGWSPDYWMYAEDADLCRRAANLGMRVAYTPDVQVVHAHGGSSRINVAVKSMTKLEVVISKHVYVQNHLQGSRRIMAHCMIALLRLPGTALGALLDILTLKKVPSLTVRSRMLGGMLTYYFGVISRGVYLSPRAIENKAHASTASATQA